MSYSDENSGRYIDELEPLRGCSSSYTYIRVRMDGF